MRKVREWNERKVSRLKTDSEGAVCPFCAENGRIKIIEETETAYLAQVLKNIDGEWVPQVGRYFINLKQHVESVLDLPDDHMVDIKYLMRAAIQAASQDSLLMRLMQGKNLEDAMEANWNNGKQAGGQVNHTHLWILFRYDDLQLGPDGLIIRCQEQADTIGRLRSSRHGQVTLHSEDLGSSEWPI